MIAGRYQREAKLGQGGMGTVYRATDAHSGDTVAVKHLTVTDPASLARFQREGQALRDLNHPNIVKMLAAVEHEGQHYLVMEYVPGGSLRDLLDQTPQLPVERVLNIALDLADALTRAHRLDIIHRDIKPANVLLAADGTPRLTDFGIAHAPGSAITATGVLMGTVAYLSPEVINSEPFDARGDIWALGVLLFEMLAGRRPFVGETMAATFHAILTAPTPDLEELRPDAPVALVDLVYRMLVKRAAERLPSVRLAGYELESLLTGRPRPAAPTSPAPLDNTLLLTKRFATPHQQPAHNLPAQLTPFVGREAELAQLKRLVVETRLATVLGAGGMGKTRLALETATRLVGTYPDGVYLVELAPLESAASIVAAISGSINLQFARDPETPRQQLLNYLRDKHMLLLLDNFEHLLDGVSTVTAILEAAPDVTILATSRERLNLQGEVLFRISGMDFPDWETPADALEYSAVKLFVQSARRVRPDFELAADDLRFVARICRLVEGTPLGVLLAAAWVDALSLEEIAAEIEASLDFLETNMSNVPDRHRSIQAVFESSWARLNGPEQAALMKLSVFRGGFTRSAAQTVTGAGLRVLTALVNKSLLRRDAASGRYAIHELLRQYAGEELLASGEADTVRDAHCAFYTGFLADALVSLRSPRLLETRRQIDTEYENVRAAWARAVEIKNVAALSEAAEGLWQYFNFRELSDDDEYLFASAIKALAMDEPLGEQGVLYGELLMYQIWFSNESIERRQQIHQQSLRILQALNAQRQIGLLLMDFDSGVDEAIQYCERSASILSECGDPWGLARTLQRLCWLHLLRGEHETALGYAERGLDIAREHGYGWLQAVLINHHGLVAATVGQHQEALAYYKAALALARQYELILLEGMILNNAALTLGVLGRYCEAEDYIQESIALSKHRVFDYYSRLDTRGYIKYLAGDFAAALSIFEECLAIANQHEWPQPQTYAHHRLGFVYLAMGDLERSKCHLREALAMAAEIDSDVPVIECLVGVAGLLMHDHRHQRALELLAYTAANPTVSRQIENEQRWLAHLEAVLPADVVTAARERAASFDLDTLVPELLEEL